MAGAEIWYEYTGDTANPYKYRVWLLFYRDITGIAAPPNPHLCVSSSCYSDFSETMTFSPFTPSPGSDTVLGTNGSILSPYMNECTGSAGGGLSTEVYRYYADVVLPGTCSDWRFGFNESARNSNDNLTSASTFYIDAQLNNILGPNSSPRFNTPAIRSFCVGSQVKWYHSAIDSEGDSLYYELARPFTSGINCPANPTPMFFKTGFSTAQPFPSTNGISLNSFRGILEFEPSQMGIYVVKIKVTEYKLDSTNTWWLHAGSIERDIEMAIVATCDTTILRPTVIPRADSGFAMPTAECNDSVLHLQINNRVQSSSIAPDGTDFALFNSKGNMIPVIAAGTNSAPYTSSIWLKLNDSLWYNDTLRLVSRTGTDMNTLLSTCGFEMDENQAIPVRVRNCTTDVQITELRFEPMALYPNPSEDVLNVEFANASGSRYVQVLNMHGQILMQVEAGNRNNKVSVADLPAGLYLLRNSESHTSRIFEKL